MVTMFDLLEHVPDHEAAAREALRVLRPGGWVLVSTPDRERWKYPYYGVFRPICPEEETLFSEWGHVRRGYTRSELEELFGAPAVRFTAFINPLLAVNHDIAFSRLSLIPRMALHVVVSPVSLVGWLMHGEDTPGTEIVAAWCTTTPNRGHQSLPSVSR
jgi:SAM-dependent methyltransferase